MARHQLEALTQAVARSLARANKQLFASTETGVAYVVTELEMSVSYASLELTGEDVVLDISPLDAAEGGGRFVRFKVTPIAEVTEGKNSLEPTSGSAVPNLKGQPLGDVLPVLAAAGVDLNSVRVDFEPTAKSAAGTVIEQTFRAAGLGMAPEVHLKVAGPPPRTDTKST